MAMTAEDWLDFEKSVRLGFGHTKLNCDGYIVHATMRQCSMKLFLFLYINGWNKGEWSQTDCEERRRFFQFKRASLHKRKEQEKIIKSNKECKKVGLKEYIRDPYQKFTYYSPYWSSFKTLRSHLLKTNKDISLVKENADATTTDSPA